MPKALLVLIADMMLVLAVGAGAAETHAQNELLLALRSRDVDQTLATLNDIKKARYQGDVLPILLSIWNGECQEDLNIPSDMCQLPIIKISVADALVQAARNGLVEANMKDIHQYAQQVFQSADIQVRKDAALVLSYFGTDQDIGLISKQAAKERKGEFRTMIAALALICGNDAEAALEKLRQSVTDKNKAIIEDTLESLTPARIASCDTR